VNIADISTLYSRLPGWQKTCKRLYQIIYTDLRLIWKESKIPGHLLTWVPWNNQRTTLTWADWGLTDCARSIYDLHIFNERAILILDHGAFALSPTRFLVTKKNTFCGSCSWPQQAFLYGGVAFVSMVAANVPFITFLLEVCKGKRFLDLWRDQRELKDAAPTIG